VQHPESCCALVKIRERCLVVQVSRILQEQRLSEKESWKQQQEIENAIFVARERSLADAHLYK